MDYGGAINFNNMIPVLKNNINEINLKILENDIKSEKEYKNLLINQLRWCNSNNKKIIANAEKLHNFVFSKSENKSLRSRCCNFPVLEEACNNYKVIKRPPNPDIDASAAYSHIYSMLREGKKLPSQTVASWG